MNTLLSGLWLGLCYAAPLGQQNLFVIGASSRGGLTNAIRVAMVVSIMDVSLAVACFYGVGALVEQWPVFESVAKAIGSVFLFYIGWNLLRPEEANLTESDKKKLPLWSLVKSCFVLTWCNAQALIDGTAIFGGMKASLSPHQVNYFIIGAAIGSIIWFSTICFSCGFVGKQITPKLMRRINAVCGLMLIAYGVKLFVSLATEI